MRVERDPVSQNPDDSADPLIGPADRDAWRWVTLVHGHGAQSSLLPQSLAGAATGGAALFVGLTDKLVQGGGAPSGVPARDQSLSTVLMTGAHFAPSQTWFSGHTAPLREGPVDTGFFGPQLLPELHLAELARASAISLSPQDFALGAEVLGRALGGLDVPVLAANLNVQPATPFWPRALAPSTVIEADGMRLGVVGVVSPTLTAAAPPQGLVVSDPLPAAQAALDALALEGVDLTVLLAAFGDPAAEDTLVAGLRGLDVAIVGGSSAGVPVSEVTQDATPKGTTPRTVHPGDTVLGTYPELRTSTAGETVVVLRTGDRLRYAGRLVAAFDTQGKLVRIDTERSDSTRVVGGGAPGSVAAALSVTAAVEDLVSQRGRDLSGWFLASSDVALDARQGPTRVLETNLGDLVADAFRATLADPPPQPGVLPPHRVGLWPAGHNLLDREIAPGSLSAAVPFDVLPEDSTLSAARGLTPSALRLLLEDAVSAYDSGADSFVQVSGLRVTYDIDQPAQVRDAVGAITTLGQRVREVRRIDDDADLGVLLVVDGLVLSHPGLTLDVVVPTRALQTSDPMFGALAWVLSAHPHERLPTTPQLAWLDWVRSSTAGLLGSVSAARYPVGGNGRIVLR